MKKLQPKIKLGNSTMTKLHTETHSGDTTMNHSTPFTQLEHDIRLNAHLHEQDKLAMLKNIQKLGKTKVNILITGPTGAGKSSTINALFGMEVATVGVGVDPETMDIARYVMDSLTLWDSPGLGDGPEKDKQHAQQITNLLQKTDNEGNALIDMVLHIIDGSQKDLGTSFEQITKVIIPALGVERKSRILVAINQADQAQKGRGWDHISNQPTATLLSFLEAKVASIQNRIKVSTGVNIAPVFYSAGYKDEFEQQAPYNLSKLLYFIIQHTPTDKAPILVLHANKDTEVWGEREEDKIYQKKIHTATVTNIIAGATAGSKVGAKLGTYFGPVGTSIGSAIGGVVGGLLGGIFA